METNTIDYNSPSGRIIIGKLVPPFQPVGSFGFAGVLAEDSESRQLQCHICGKWFDGLSSHLNGTHEVTADEYKEQYGLLKSTALRSKKMRVRQSETMALARKNHPEKFTFKNRKGSRLIEQSANMKGKKNATERYNRTGTCDLQIATKILELANELGRTPRLFELADRHGKNFTSLLQYRYDDYKSLCLSIGLKEPVRTERKYSKEYFVKIGVEKVKNGIPFHLPTIFSNNEYKRIRAYYTNNQELKDEIIKELITK